MFVNIIYLQQCSLLITSISMYWVKFLLHTTVISGKKDFFFCTKIPDSGCLFVKFVQNNINYLVILSPWSDNS